MEARPSPPVLAGVLIGLVAIVPFVPTLHAWFLADDWFFVAAYGHADRSFGALAWSALTSLDGVPTTFYRPVPFLSLAAQLRLDAADALGAHALNIALHGLSARSCSHSPGG